MQNTFFFLLLFLLGGSLGSFLHAYALRVVQIKESILDPSKCRFCKKKLTFTELIPIISWLMQRGRSRCCNKRLAWGYLLAELFLALTYPLTFYFLPVETAIFFSILMSLLLFSFLTDAYFKVLHLPMIFLTGIVGIIFNSFDLHNLYLSILGGLIGFTLLWGINKLYFLLRKQEGFGGGDKYLLGAIGLWVGPMKIIAIFFIASWVGSLYAFYKMWRNQASLKTALPLGVFLSITAPIIFLI